MLQIFQNIRIYFVCLKFCVCMKWHFLESLKYNVFVNFPSWFRFVHRIPAPMASDGNGIPSVRSHSTNNIHQDLNPDDDESDYNLGPDDGVDHDANDEMNIDDVDYIRNDGPNNSYRIQYVHFKQWIFTSESADI